MTGISISISTGFRGRFRRLLRRLTDDVKIRRRTHIETVMHKLIDQHRAEIAELCRRYAVRRLEVFGSAARGEDFDPSRSDADFLVEFDAPSVSLATFLDFKEALEALLGRPVDLVERGAVEESRNYIRRRSILADAETIYAR